MRYSLLPCIFAIALLGLPSAAEGQLPATAWSLPFQALPIPGGGPVENLALKNGAIYQHPLPSGFTFEFGGASYNRINIGMKGYVTFGASTTDHDVTNADAGALLTAQRPWNVVAAWWGDHHCAITEGDLRSQVVGQSPNRWFVVEWRCGKREGNQTSSTTFEAQLRFLEGSNVIQAHYGELNYVEAYNWSVVSWGLKPGNTAGLVGPDREGKEGPCNPERAQGVLPKCNAKLHFPADSAIQYGLVDASDLTATVARPDIAVRATTIAFDARTVLKNLGTVPVAGAKYELYLSPSRSLDDPAALLLAGSETPATIGAGGSRSLIETITAPRPPNGIYWLCALVDPDEEIADFDRSNNAVCSFDRNGIGPDLVGTIEAPPEGTSGETVSIELTFRNVGNVASTPFDYRISIEPDAFADGTKPRDEDVYVGSIGAIPVAGTVPEVVSVRLPPTIRGDRYRFVLTIDIHGTVDESDRSNNVARSPSWMDNLKPHLKLSGPAQIDMPDGCFYGERIEARFEVCNEGVAVAENFRPGISIGAEDYFSILNDVPAATLPQSCLRPGHPSATACEPINGREPVCALESCRLECTADEDCGDGLVCGEDRAWAEARGLQSVKSCVNSIAAKVTQPVCQSFVARGTIPPADQDGVYYTDSIRHFHLVSDISYFLSQRTPDMRTSQAYHCREALPDLAVQYLAPDPGFVAGKLAKVTRSILNLGFIEKPKDGSPRPTSIDFRYRYFLGTNPTVSDRHIPVPFAFQGDAGAATIGRKGTNQGTDTLLLPEQLEAGDYWLALVLDTDGEHRELSKENNVYVFPTPIRIEAASFRIVTERLPTAIVGASFRHSLVVEGADGPVEWSADHLPAGLELDSDGTLVGVPRDEGQFSLVIRARSGELSSQKLFALRILAPSSEMEVITSTLPPAVRNKAYGGWVDEFGTRRAGIQLAAAGGQPPYVWDLDPSSDRIPQGLSGPTAQGEISGMATTLSQTSSITVRVRDRIGNSATRTLTIPVVNDADLVITSHYFAEGRTSRDYDSCITATGGDGAKPYQWDVDEATLPPGLWPLVRERSLCLVGAPTECSHYQVSVMVSEGGGQSYRTAIPLSVSCSLLQSTNRELPAVSRGESVEVDLAADALSSGRWRIYQGSLPRGLLLSEEGLIAGTVADDADFGPYGFVTELRDSRGSVALSALAITVLAPQVEGKLVKKKTTGSGCSSSGGGLGLPAGLGFLVLGLFGGRRRGSGPANARRLGVALAIFAAGAAIACGSEGEETVLDRCVDTVCERGMSCDQEDGVCKCGEELCRGTDVCKREPNPHCVAVACEFVSCERGESCDNETGACSCNGISCEEGESCVDQRCITDDRCGGVSCDGELACDPIDGACKCEGVACEQGEICSDGVCTFDRCLAVRCGPNSVCDPSDGICRCPSAGGEICQGGEACVDSGEGFHCAAVDLCEDTFCSGGTSCDPSDGLCHCGGFGVSGPVCAEEQTCIDGACLGGLLCEPAGIPLECDPGFSCDPADGVCKCGGAGGLSCDPEQRCLQSGSSFRCVSTCDPLARDPGCGTRSGCYYEPQVLAGEAFCSSAGTQAIGFECERSSNCQPGHHCSSGGRCVAVCEVSKADCSVVSPTAVCAGIVGGPAGMGYCLDG